MTASLAASSPVTTTTRSKPSALYAVILIYVASDCNPLIFVDCSTRMALLVVVVMLSCVVPLYFIYNMLCSQVSDYPGGVVIFYGGCARMVHRWVLNCWFEFVFA